MSWKYCSATEEVGSISWKPISNLYLHSRYQSNKFDRSFFSQSWRTSGWNLENRSLQFAPKQLTEFVVMEMEFADSADVCTTGEVQSTKHISSDVYVSRPNEIVMYQTHTRTHLGRLLRPGDTVLCFYFRYSNVNHPVLETMKGDKKFQTSKWAVRLDLPRRTAATVLWNSTAETKPIGASFVDIFIWHAPV